MRRALLAAAIISGLLLGGAVVALVVDRQGRGEVAELEVVDPDGSVEHDYVIPEGTADRLARGEEVEIVPQRLEVAVGESIRIRNEDDAGASVGIFWVGAGEVVRMRFTTPGELKGTCDIHPSGEFTIAVSDP